MSACAPRVAHGVELADVWVLTRRLKLSRSGFGRTEFPKLCSIQGRSCCGCSGRFGVSEEFLSLSRREDVAWSRGDVVS
ncbi:hypothetical protein Taro_022155 [Colocasia esculenta]|uniref:Uncharacterized protein n=1 Tax=Colocasia esculenta TaxID=4460 RepID=A0A843VAI3_COLES|nr:hypothetical protein [Colocasia esculenta]